MTIHLRLKAFDPALLGRRLRQVCAVAQSHGATVRGPFGNPTAKTVYTVLRSPHVHKKARDQFALTTHRRRVTLSDVALGSACVHALTNVRLVGVQLTLKLTTARYAPPARPF